MLLLFYGYNTLLFWPNFYFKGTNFCDFGFDHLPVPIQCQQSRIRISEGPLYSGTINVDTIGPELKNFRSKITIPDYCGVGGGGGGGGGEGKCPSTVIKFSIKW